MRQRPGRRAARARGTGLATPARRLEEWGQATVEFALVLVPLLLLLLMILDLAPVLEAAMVVPFAAARAADAAGEGASYAQVVATADQALPDIAPSAITVTVTPPIANLVPQGWVSVRVTAEVPVPVAFGPLPPVVTVAGSATEQVW